jgi:hypothetical protein
LRPADTDTARTEPLRVQTHGFAPQPAVLAGGDPDWLAAHLARDAALNERSEWSGRWTRRLAAWGAAGVLLALLAGGGLWLYQQSQVEGALVVVANTNPAPAGAAAHRGFGHAAPDLPATAPVSSNAAMPAPAVEEAPPPMADVKKTAGVGAPGGLTGGSTGASTAHCGGRIARDRRPQRRERRRLLHRSRRRPASGRMRRQPRPSAMRRPTSRRRRRNASAATRASIRKPRPGPPMPTAKPRTASAARKR